MSTNKIDPGHNVTRNVLRVLGPILVLTGQCGQALSKTKPCPNCHEWNDPDARFCDNCGQAFG